MDHKALKSCRHMFGLSQSDMADMLGYKRRTYQMMERGTAEIRNGVGLSCAAYALGITHYDGEMVREHWERTQAAKQGKKAKR